MRPGCQIRDWESSVVEADDVDFLKHTSWLKFNLITAPYFSFPPLSWGASSWTILMKMWNDKMLLGEEFLDKRKMAAFDSLFKNFSGIFSGFETSSLWNLAILRK